MSHEPTANETLQGEIERLTRRLRLPYVRAAAPELLKSARSQRWDPAEALRVLLEEEVAGRDKSGREMRRQTAAFPHQKTFHTWREGASSIPLHVQHALRGAGVDRAAREPHPVRRQRHRQEPLPRSPRASGHRP
jgi:DNA replication protein DnaC